MGSEIFGQQLPAEVIQADHRLEKAAEGASEALAKHRWHWTLDESNEARVSFGQYARGVGKSEFLIRKYAKAYVLVAHSQNGDVLIGDAIERSTMGAKQAQAVGAVAEARGISMVNARQHYKEEVQEVKHAVENKAEQHEEKGEEFTPDDQADYAKRLAEIKKRTREREAREREEYKANHSWQFMEAMARVGKARQQLRSALKIIREAEFTDDEKEIIEQTNSDTQALSSMITAALTGDSGVDWDRELAALDGRAHDAGE